MTTREEIEKALQEKYQQGEADTGLYYTGLCYVVMDLVDDQLQFQWFDTAIPLSSVMAV